ncbi:translation initiation factor IF-3, mitochondrial [Pungitius pungitius]|uniref:translation initiation factor IF-3, mitochondrial n=1 Tax=Pungitius pungitius TaxID=134920 RepID=UPI002E0D7A51
MSAACVRWTLGRTLRAVCGGPRCHWAPAARPAAPGGDGPDVVVAAASSSSLRRSPFSTDAGDSEQAPAPKAKNKRDPKAQGTIGAVGRRIPHREVQVISETGENLGTMHRADVIRVLDERGLKLVLLSDRRDPPVYRLMSGKQIHEEQLKLREKQKAKAAPVQVKELTFSSGIAAHDLSTKLKQVEGWLEKKNHVRITLRSGRGGSAVNLDTNLEQIVQQMEVMFGFVSKPKAVRDGQAAVCVLRPPSAKELSQQPKSKGDPSQSDDSTSRATESQAAVPPVGDTDAAEGSARPGSGANKTLS